MSYAYKRLEHQGIPMYRLSELEIDFRGETWSDTKPRKVTILGPERRGTYLRFTKPFNIGDPDELIMLSKTIKSTTKPTEYWEYGRTAILVSVEEGQYEMWVYTDDITNV